MWLAGSKAMASVNFALFQISVAERETMAKAISTYAQESLCSICVQLCPHSEVNLHSLVEILLSNRLVAQSLELVSAHDAVCQMPLLV